MPRKRRSNQAGQGIKEIVAGAKKVNDWLRKTKAISKVAGVLGSAGVPYASSIGKVAGSVGYGKRRRSTRIGVKGTHRKVKF